MAMWDPDATMRTRMFRTNGVYGIGLLFLKVGHAATNAPPVVRPAGSVDAWRGALVLFAPKCNTCVKSRLRRRAEVSLRNLISFFAVDSGCLNVNVHELLNMLYFSNRCARILFLRMWTRPTRPVPPTMDLAGAKHLLFANLRVRGFIYEGDV